MICLKGIDIVISSENSVKIVSSFSGVKAPKVKAKNLGQEIGNN